MTITGRGIMKCNVGGGERKLRFGVAVCLTGAGTLLPVSRGLRALLLGAAAISAVTAGLRYCPLNRALGRSSYGWTDRLRR